MLPFALASQVFAQQATVQQKGQVTFNKLLDLRAQLDELENDLNDIVANHQWKIGSNDASITMVSNTLVDISATMFPPKVEIYWDEMPVGSPCGMFMMTGGNVSGRQINCQGHDPRTSCPAGYLRADLGYFEAGNGSRKLAMCVKTAATGNEKDWDNMPSSSLCGVYMRNNSGVQARVDCQGHNPHSDCPDGFTRVSKGYFETGGSNDFEMCIKD